jgi:MFS family permease
VTDDTTPLSPRAAVVIGLLVMAVGTLIVLLALGVVTDSPPSPDTPPWVVACAGLIFVLGGAAMIVGYALAGGPARDGDLPPGTPTWMRVTQLALGLGIVGALGAVAGWVAFGPGPRTFTTTGSFGSGQVDDGMGRAVFGFGAVLIGVFFVALLVVSVRRLRRRR